MYVFAPLLGAILFYATFAVAARLIGEAYLCKNREVLAFSLGFTLWGPALYFAMLMVAPKDAGAQFVVQFVFVFVATMLTGAFLYYALHWNGAVVLIALAALLGQIFGDTILLLMDIFLQIDLSREVPKPALGNHWLFSAMFWNVGLAVGLWPIAWRTRRRLHKAANRKCIECDYDLKGVPGHLCPECGEPFREPRDGDLPHQGAL
jgi:hypothetical protein